MTDVPKTNRRVVRHLMGDFALDNWHEHRVDREAFIIYVGGDTREMEMEPGIEPGVTHHMADRLEMNLSVLAHLNATKPILIVLASCGGNWEEGMQMLSAILTAPNPITIVAVKHARSMTSLIPLAADRFLLRPPADFMYHYGMWGFDGLAGEEAWTHFERLREANNTMLRLYVNRLKEQGKFKGQHPAKIRGMLEDKMRRKVDVFLSADEAIEWGFADGLALGQIKRAEKKNIKRRNSVMAVLRRPRGF